MLHLLLGLIVLVVGIVLLKKLFKFIMVVAGGVLGMVAAVFMGPAALLAILLEKCSNALRLKLVMPYLMLSGFSLLVGWVYLEGRYYGLQDSGFGYYRNLITLLLALAVIGAVFKTRGLNAINANQTLLLKKERQGWALFHAALLLTLCAIISPWIAAAIEPLNGLQAWLGGAYWVAALLVQLYALMDSHERRTFCTQAFAELSETEQRNAREHCETLADEHHLDQADAEALYQGCVVLLVERGVLHEYEILSDSWVFKAEWDAHNRRRIEHMINSSARLDLDAVVHLISQTYCLNQEQARDFLEFSAGLGVTYGIGTEAFFVPLKQIDNIRVCTSCGHAEEGHVPEQGEWFCSSTCRETENLCLEIKDKPYKDFLDSAATSGFVLMAGGAALDANHKLFATGGQGHGFAAENANHRIDKLMMKKAEIVGGDNAKNGADRLVDGASLQTKYCKTAARSVGAGFDGQGGNYKYLDAQGKPMQIEVPKDQYELAVETMKNKIKDGKVPGVSDPEQAKDLVVKGHLTYDQAKNITKFGTLESVTYDIAEGAIVGAVAGGISFALSACVYYASTGDKKQALKVAAIQGGKTFGKSLTVYVGAQQLNRVAVVQKVLSKIDVSALSHSKRSLLQKGFGVSSKNSLNKALRGTVITSIVLIAVTTGPDMVKMVRGRISKAQFVKNLAVVSSGIAGGTIGSIAGGIVFSPFGPVSAMLGRAAGGIIGGVISSVITNKIAGKLMEEDRVRMLKLVQYQLEYLAVSFMLTKDELQNLNNNLDQILQPKTLEIIHAAKSEQRAMANFILKPVVVSVVKQRPALQYEGNDIFLACEEIAA
ncbi:hypothetical protein [Shewanella algae]|uniref:hypothetical protein n=1 Tax=Shewanella algae TaxID=38313 RepID=UPI0016558A70|nr:hypothetical protein [Shewanella algae]MBC8798374.1 hypothetical protein [Shewanella algae]